MDLILESMQEDYALSQTDEKDLKYIALVVTQCVCGALEDYEWVPELRDQV